jgi:CCR4-NOT transcription complex subunit 7/8
MTTLFTTKFSADSPPFNPRTSNNGNNNNHSRSSSPVANGGAANAASYCSNAIPKYTFPYGDNGTVLEIRNVWAENVELEMAEIRRVVETYHYIAMDTEFPGIVAKPVTETYSPDYHYKSMKVNVDLLKIIQLGLSFADAEGNFAPGCPCWQFNFRFDLDGDMFAQDSIDLLQNSGISFDDHAKRGIDPHLFGELLTVSGMVLDDRVKWVSFHSGYDYGYLLKLLTTVDLPNDEKSFFELLKIYFPTIYDIKYMTSLLDGHQFMGGLQKLADDLKCQRLGAEHQAGSDSLLTMSTFFALVKAKFRTWDETKYANELFGYGTNHTVRKLNNAAVVNAGTRTTTMTAALAAAAATTAAVVAADAGSVLSTGSND